jgi:glycosyltransferase involved in cell wall biosynthesis
VFVTFIVPALNEEKHIRRCLEAIQQLTRPPEVRGIEIIVVDNQSTDDTVLVSEDCGATIVAVPPGFSSRARNAGARVARGDWLAFVDADCELDAHWLTTCAIHVIRDPDTVAVAGGMRAPQHGASWVEQAWHELAYAPTNAAPMHVRWLASCNLLVRREAFQRVGGYNESLATCEDCDLAYKLAEAGKLVLDSRTQVLHLGESRSLVELFRREAWRSHGNLRLAFSRPRDWSNWFSLLAPLCVSVILILSASGAAFAQISGGAVWPWFGIAAGVLCLILMVVAIKSRATAPLTLAKQVIVFITYLAGRATGLVWPFRRVNR